MLKWLQPIRFTIPYILSGESKFCFLFFHKLIAKNQVIVLKTKFGANFLNVLCKYNN